MIKNLVFEGGGIKGVAFIGVVKALEDKNILKNINNFAGSSAGAIVATCLALKLSSKNLEDILLNLDFTKFKDSRWGIIRKFYYFMTKYGIYQGKYFMKYLESVLVKYTGNDKITFQEVYNRYGTNLVITGTNLDKGIVEYFCHETHPNMPVKIAIRISMSIPYIFEAIKYEGYTWTDGGVLNNYPFSYFDDTQNILGFKLVSKDEKRDDIIHHRDKDINNIKDFSLSLIKAMMNQIERLYIDEDYWNKTITINTFGINAIDFDLDNEKKKMLIAEGYSAVNNHFYNKEKL